MIKKCARLECINIYTSKCSWKALELLLEFMIVLVLVMIRQSRQCGSFYVAKINKVFVIYTMYTDI